MSKLIECPKCIGLGNEVSVNKKGVPTVKKCTLCNGLSSVDDSIADSYINDLNVWDEDILSN